MRRGGGRGRRSARRGGGGGFSPAAASGSRTAAPACLATPRADRSRSRRRHRRRGAGGNAPGVLIRGRSLRRAALQRSGRRAHCAGPAATPGQSSRAGGREAPGAGWASARAPLAGACLSRRLAAQVNSIGGRRRRRGLPGWTGGGRGRRRHGGPGSGLRSPTATSAPAPDARSSRSGTSSARGARAAGATAPPPSRPARPAPRRPSSRPGAGSAPRGRSPRVRHRQLSRLPPRLGPEVPTAAFPAGGRGGNCNAPRPPRSCRLQYCARLGKATRPAV